VGALTETGKAVFLSYASQDAEAAQHLCNVLRAAGIEVWFDQSELRGGDAWDQMIRRQVKGCYLFVPIISANTQSRKEGYFRREWKLAADRTNDMAEGISFLLPVVIDDTSDLEALVPEKFREVQWTRLPQGANTDAFAEHVRRLIALETTASTSAHPRSHPTPAPSTSLPPSAAPARSAPPTNRSVLPWVVIGLLILGIGYFAAGKYLVSKLSTTTAEAPVTALVKPNVVSDKSIAVLPFADMSEKKDQEYFADGMAEEILDLLVKVPELRVIARTSSFQFKGENIDLRTIGDKLGTRYVLEGSVRKSGNRLRVTAQLIDIQDGTHLMSETYERDLADVLNMQDEIALAVVRTLQIAVGADGFVARPKLQNTEAYVLYLKGRRAYDRFDQQGFEEALSDFQRALELDPTMAGAAAAIAVIYASLGEWGFMPPAVAFEQARGAAEQALKFDPDIALAHAVLGSIHDVYDWDWAAATVELQKALALSPKDESVLFEVARHSMIVGRWDEAFKQINACLAADPFLPQGYAVLNWIQVRRGRLAEAEAAGRHVIERSPTYVGAHYYLGVALLMAGKDEAALAEIQKEPDDGARINGLAIVYHALGRKMDSDAALAKMVKDQAKDNAYGVAEVYAFRGEKDQAFKWLDRAYAQKDVSLCYIKGDPPLKSLDGDPRYKAFLRKMNLPD